MFFTIPQLIAAVNGKCIQKGLEEKIRGIVTDTRRGSFFKKNVFVTLIGPHHDAHHYVAQAYQKGIRTFIVSRPVELPEEATIIHVENTLDALQQLARYHRQTLDHPFIGITGSNGKTIVKEWMHTVLSQKWQTGKNPKSYNSQVGVPLSILRQGRHDYSIIEAGISRPGEMQRLEAMIMPQFGIFTNIGAAHDEGFSNRLHKAEEKADLFKHTNKIIFRLDDNIVYQTLFSRYPNKLVSWSDRKKEADYFYNIIQESTSTTVYWKDNVFKLPFIDDASVENALHVLTCSLELEMPHELITRGLWSLRSVNMRLEIKRARQNSYIIDDSYNNDLDGLEIALSFLNQHHFNKQKVLILGDFPEQQNQKHVFEQVTALLIKYEVKELHTIGNAISAYTFPDVNQRQYPDVDAFLNDPIHLNLSNRTMLIKGPRSMSFERISEKLSEKSHQTTLEINLHHLEHNLKIYRIIAGQDTRLMVMVKAFAYGSGNEIISVLQQNHVDYLAVAYPDEGIRLRHAGITLPIMVLNPLDAPANTFLQYNLEPEVYSIELLNRLCEELQPAEELNIHLKLDTGMHRLGLDADDVNAIGTILKRNPGVKVKSIMSHLAASDEEEHSAFTLRQIRDFDERSEVIMSRLSYRPLRHIANTSAISRFPEAHFDMLRLGIGLYGFDGAADIEKQLLPVGRLTASVSQVKIVPEGESVGYGRHCILTKDTTIATVSIGYADGFDRSLGNGKSGVYIHGRFCPTVGNVCMDMTMVEVGDLTVNAGDEVVIFENQEQVKALAAAQQTIPYEIISSIHERVKRIYTFDG